MVAGGCGFLGARTSSLLLQKGWRVTTLGHGNTPDILAGSVNHCDGLISKDLFHMASEKYGEPDVIIHAAGGASVGRSWEDPSCDFNLSVGSTFAILEFIRGCKVSPRLVLVSSAAVYGNVGSSEPLLEDDVCKPVSPYGLHKLLCEQLVEGEARMRPLDASIVRFFSIYGAGLRKQILWDIMHKIKERPDEVLELWGAGDETRDFLHVLDASDLIVKLAESNSKHGVRVFNGASGVSISIAELAAGLLKAAEVNTHITFNGRIRSGDPKHLRANVEKSEKELGFIAQTKLSDGLKDYVKWFASLDIEKDK